MTNIYENPLCTRYAGKKMQEIFSSDVKFRTWRKLWIALAKAEKSLGIDITDEQIAELEKYKDDINYDAAREYEKKLRHDVMAHVHSYGDQAVSAKGIIHLGATSCYVGDNTDIIVIMEALKEIRKKLVTTIASLYNFAEKYKTMPALAFTHFQPAQPTTVGKRATLWLQDLVSDLGDLDYLMGTIKLLGCKGTTGTQASFLELFDGDGEKVDKLEALIEQEIGMESYSVSGQTYSRKVDYRVESVLSSIAQSASKFANDFRLLSHLKEVDEPFESGQIGSSAMAYKRNPMRSERICSLARFVMSNPSNTAYTASTQWFERTLDDSANKRISIPQSFLALDGVLTLYNNIISGCRVYEKQVEKRLNSELPFMATENILMHAVKNGGDRQELHEVIRTLSVEAGIRVKNEGLDNNLLEKIIEDDRFGITKDDLETVLDTSKFIGRAIEQTDKYLSEVKEVLDKNREYITTGDEITV